MHPYRHRLRDSRKALHFLALVVAVLFTCAAVAVGQTTQADNKPQVSATLRTDRTQRFVGERFTLTLTIISRNVHLGNQFNLTRLPAESIVKLGSFRELKTRQNRKDGVTEEIRQFRCDVDASDIGRIRMEPALHFEIKKREKFLIGSAWVTSSRRISVTPLDLTIVEVPKTGRPDSYSGAIGRFTFKAAIHPREVMVGELITVDMKIRGTGRIEGITVPSVQSHPWLKTYPPKATASAPTLLDAEQTIIPQSTNLTSVPVLEFSYFDPASRQYKIIRQGAFPLRFRSDEQRDTYKPFRPTESQSIREPALRQVISLAGQTRADLYRTSTFILTVLASLIALGGLVHIALGRRLWRQGTVLIVIAIAGGLLAAWTWRTAVQLVPDRVMTRGTLARLAPAHTALRIFDLQEGSVIKIREQWEQWIKVETEGKSGWVPADSVKTQEDSP